MYPMRMSMVWSPRDEADVFDKTSHTSVIWKGKSRKVCRGGHGALCSLHIKM